MGLPDPARPEGAEAQLDHHPVEEDHCGNVPSAIYRVLDLAHKQQVSRLREPVVGGVVGNVAYHGPGAAPAEKRWM